MQNDVITKTGFSPAVYDLLGYAIIACVGLLVIYLSIKMVGYVFNSLAVFARTNRGLVGLLTFLLIVVALLDLLFFKSLPIHYSLLTAVVGLFMLFYFGVSYNENVTNTKVKGHI